MVFVGVGTVTGVLDTAVLTVEEDTEVELLIPDEPPIVTVAGFDPPS
jgi:hypothetical protein